MIIITIKTLKNRLVEQSYILISLRITIIIRYMRGYSIGRHGVFKKNFINHTIIGNCDSTLFLEESDLFSRINMI